MKNRYFDIKRDMAIAKAGGFFCQACLVGKPAGEQSPDGRYCQGCYAFLQNGGKAVEPSKDYYWSQNGTFFILEGQKYGVTKKTGATVCLGPVETPPAPNKTAPGGQKGVSKLPEGHPLPPEELQAHNKEVVLKHPGGRPRKKEDEKVSRVTAWRRKKEKQGVLFE